MKKFVLLAILFCLIGEVLLRIDEKLQLFQASRVLKIKTDIDQNSAEYDQVDNGLPFPENSLRIMVLGDSYINGPGLQKEEKFSNVLRSRLRDHEPKPYSNTFVLDLSRPSNNNIDNVNTYFKYADIFMPQIIVWAYNVNDVDLVRQDSVGRLNESGSITANASDKKFRQVKELYDMLYNSKLINYVLHNVHRYLKSKGVIVRNSQLDLELKSYAENKQNWQYSKKAIENLINDTESRNTEVYVMVMPQMDILHNTSIFRQADSVIGRKFGDYGNVIYMNFRDSIDSKIGEDFLISRYNEHLNAKGHRYLAEKVANKIFDNQSKK